MHDAVAMAVAAVLLLSASHYGNNGNNGNVIGAFPATLAFVLDDRRPSPHPLRPMSTRTMRSPHRGLHMSSVGGGDDNNGNDNDEDNPLNEWIRRRDSENVRRAREQSAEGRLPISYGAMNTEDEEGGNPQQQQQQQQQGSTNDSNDGTTMGVFGPLQDGTRPTSIGDGAVDAGAVDAAGSSLSRGAAPNPYLHVVSRLAPSDLIGEFTSTASPRVQDAVRATILGLIGGLPQMAFGTRTVATGERLASLMFQLQMTGYMFKNAEYRLSLTQSLGGVGGGAGLLPGDGAVGDGGGRIRGKIKVRYGAGGDGADDGAGAPDGADAGEGDAEGGERTSTSGSSTPGMEVEVDAEAYMSELRGEVSRLRDELDATKQAKEEEIRKDLL